MKKKSRCIYDQWYDGELTNPNGFTRAIIKTWQEADGNNKHRLKEAFPEFFKDSAYI